jgi:glycosyltransferase involved in cell wall biosynthesis
MLVSIIIPVYNGEKTIKSAIESVINQNCKDFELIIIDGNSSDDTMNVVSEFQNYISYNISEPDKGYADAFNKGVKVATGDFIMMLAADDWLLPLAIDKFKNSVNNDTEVWCGSIIQKMPYGFRLRKSNPDLEKLRTGCSLENPASFYKRNLFDEYGFFDINWKCAADREMFLRLYVNGVKFQIEQIPIVLFEMGGLSTGNPEMYGIPEDEAISIKYGLHENDAKEATELIRKILYKEKNRAPLKKILSSVGLLKFIYKIVGKSDGCLTKSRLISYGLTPDKIN